MLFAKHAAICRTHSIFTAKGAAILKLQHFTRRHTAARPSKCGASSTKLRGFLREKAARFTQFFQVPPRLIYCILFDVYHTYICIYVLPLLLYLHLFVPSLSHSFLLLSPPPLLPSPPQNTVQVFSTDLGHVLPLKEFLVAKGVREGGRVGGREGRRERGWEGGREGREGRKVSE